MLLLLSSADLSATHFRYGQITWAPDPAVPGKIDFTINSAWRRSFGGWCGTGSCVGNSITATSTFFFGDGTSDNSPDIVVSENVADDWIFVTRTISRTYTTSGNFTAFFESCCRLSTLSNGADGTYREQTIVNIDLTDWANNNSPPNSSLPVIVGIQQGNVTATFQVPGFDPDGDVLSYRLATMAEYGISNPTGLSVDMNTGLATFLPPAGGFVLGDTYAAGIVVEDGQSQTIIDFLIEVVGTSQAPFFNYGPTPNNNSIFTVNPGMAVNFTVEADDNDSPSTVLLQATGAPMGSTFTPGLPTTPAAGPVSSAFSWTPTNADVGSYVISISVTDDFGVQAFTTVVINVSLAPVFDVPPTLGEGSLICLPTGAFSETYQASDNDPLDNVSIISAVVDPNLPPTMPTPPSTPGGGFPGMSALPSGLSFSPTIPTVAANPTSTTLSGTISNPDWGIYWLRVTAEDGFSETTELNNYFIVNQDPYFTSPTPVSNVQASVGVPFSMTITATDDDLIYGDRVAFADASRAYTTYPSWISINDDGNGNLTLTGTPTAADLGINPVVVELHDRTTHFQHLHCSWQFQSFNIEVSDCSITIDNVTPTDEICLDANNGTITVDAICTGCTGALSYTLSGTTTAGPQASNVFMDLPDGTYSVTVNDTNDPTCESTIGAITIAAGTSPDFDNDKVCDDVDLDDDNDGILDEDECPPVNFLGNSSMETYSQCPNFSTASTITFADGWVSGGGQLMVNDPGTCVSNKPGLGGWPASSALSGGSDGMNWLGMHRQEHAINTLSLPIPNGLSTALTFDAGYVVAPGFFESAGILEVYGLQAGQGQGQGTLLGSANINNELSSTNENWQTYTINFTATAEYTKIEFLAPVNQAASYMYFDNLVILSDQMGFCDPDGDLMSNEVDLDSDADNCFDVLEAGYADPDGDGILGTSPVTVDAFGRVLNEGGYTGNNGASTDGSIFTACCDIDITSVTSVAEVCPDANDGSITVAATCTTCTSINYSISGPVSVGPQVGNIFMNLPDGSYTVTVTDAGDGSCTATEMNVVVTAGVDTEDPTFVDGSEILLYENDFESPLNPINASDCGGGIDLAPGINFWFGTPAYMFQQVFSVEAADVQWPGYSDPSGIGGRYAVGMLSSAQDDLLSLTFDADDKTFLNVRMDLSPIGLNGCATSNPTTPTMRLLVYDSPGGTFNISSPGTPLDFADLTGLAPDPVDPKHVYIWQEVIAGLDISGSTDGNVSLVWDLRAGYYAAFDNLAIRASNVSAGTGCPEDFIIECIGDLPTAPTLMGFDNCTANPPVTFMQSAINGAVNDQTVTRTWTVTDASNNSFSCVQNITVDDTTDPTPMCQDITVNLLTGATYALTAAEVNDNSTDNCGTTNLSIPATTFDCDDVGNTVSVTLTVDDGNGNDATCVSMVTITDTNNTCCDIAITSANPTAEVCPGDDDGQIVVAASCTTCTSISYSISPDPNGVNPQSGGTFMNLPDGTYTVTVTDSGNSSCTATEMNVIVAAGVDSETPTPGCTDITVELNSSGTYDLTVANLQAITAGSTDNCTDPNDLVFVVAQTSFDCSETEPVVTPPAVWINEIHYDNAGGDVMEGVEVAGTAGFDLTGYSLVRYNRISSTTNAVQGGTIALGGTITNSGGASEGFGFLFSPITGLQNGPRDGIALVDDSGGIVQFLSWEGEVTATDGPAMGITSEDIGVAENASTPVGESLQLIGSGSSYDDFVWAAPSAATSNAVNNRQALVPLGSIRVTAEDEAGNLDSCFVQITVQDNIPPTPDCNDITVTLDNTGTYSLTATDLEAIAAGSMDNCSVFGDLTLSSDQTSFGCDDVSLPAGMPNTLALDFDGINDRASTNQALPELNNFTLEYYVFPRAGNGNFDRITGTRNNIEFETAVGPTGNLHYWFLDEPGWNFTDVFIPLNTWTQVAWVKDGSDYRLYINGVHSYTANVVANVDAIIWSIGGNFSGNQSTNSILDEVRIWNVPRTAGEIAANYDKTLSGVEPGLLAYYTMEDGSGSMVLSDVTGNGYDATLTDMEVNSDWVPPGSPAMMMNGTGAAKIVMTITDESGNEANCNASIFVQDNIPPTFACPADMDVDLDANCELVIPDLISGLTATDNCNVTFEQTPTANTVATGLNDGGSQVVNIVATDQSGNTNVTACLVTLTANNPGSVAISDVTMSEGDAGMTSFDFTVTLTNPGCAFSVDYSTADNGAAAGADYVATSGTLNFTAGQSSQTISVTVNGDTDVEFDDEFFVNLTNATNGVSITDAQGLGTITNDDAAEISITDVSQVEMDAANNMVFTVSLSEMSVETITVMYSTANGTATGGSDYTASTGTVTFAPGSQSETIVIPILGETIVESDETFTVTLSSPTNATISATMGAATGTIVNDDAAAITLDNVTLVEGTGGTTTTSFTFNATLDSDVQDGFDLAYTTNDGTAAAGSDYTDNDGTLTFLGTAGETQTITVLVDHDAMLEADETFTVLLGALSNLGAGVDPSNITVQSTGGDGVITNDDAVNLTIDDVTLAEGTGGTTTSFTFSATLDNAVQGGFDLAYTTNDGTATLADSDYTDNDGTLSFAGTMGETQMITVLVNHDNTVESDETFTVLLGALSNLAAGVDAADITVQADGGDGVITNDDAAVLNIADVSDQEANSPFDFEVTLTNPLTVDITFTVSTTDGTATSGDSDYVPLTNMAFTIPAGQTSVLVPVSVIDNNINEPDEAFTVSIANAMGSPDLSVGDGVATGTILNDDPVTISIDDVTITEGNAGQTGLVFTVSLDAMSSQSVTVDYTTQDGDATTSDNDYAATSGTLVFSPGQISQMITVQVIGDLGVELDEQFTIFLSNPTIATIADETGTGTIENDDAAIVVLDPAGATVTEGDAGNTPMSFPVNLTGGPVDVDVVINYVLTDGTATLADSDYSDPNSGTISLPAGQSTVDITVFVTGDTNNEDDESFSLTITNIDATGRDVTLGNATAPGNIIDDDFTCPTLGVITGEQAICISEDHQLSTTGLMTMAGAENNELDFGIRYVYFTSATADPYTGGTDLGIVDFANLEAGGIEANLDVTFPAAVGEIFVYAVLSPTPTEPTCRPSLELPVNVYACGITNDDDTNPMIADPCSCKDNATTLIDGQFDELVQVFDAPAGQTWTVVAIDGLFQSSSPAPPMAPMAIGLGTMLTEVPTTTPGVSDYELTGVHVDGVGYSIMVSNGTTTLALSNRCWYPNPSFDNLAASYCRTNGAVTLLGSAQLGDGSGEATPESETFMVVNMESGATVVNAAEGSAILDIANLPAGRYRVIFTFNGADDDPDQSHPGCSQSIEQEFEILEVNCGSFPWGGN